MSQKRTASSNAQTLKKLGDAFADLAEGRVSIPQRNSREVAKYLRKLEKAKQATRDQNIKFG